MRGKREMKKLLLLVVAIIILSMLITMGCGEQESLKTTPTGIDFILKYDKDGDGKVSLKEYPYDDFSAYDINSDGFILLVETPKDSRATADQISFILIYDKDGDAKVSQEEFNLQSFDVYDLNNDGFIEPLESPGIGSCPPE